MLVPVSMCVHLCVWMSDCMSMCGSPLSKLGDPYRTTLLCTSYELPETGTGESQGSWSGREWAFRVGLEAGVRAGWCCFAWDLA